MGDAANFDTANFNTKAPRTPRGRGNWPRMDADGRGDLHGVLGVQGATQVHLRVYWQRLRATSRVGATAEEA